MGVGRRCPCVRDVTVSPGHLLKTNVNFVLAKCYIRAVGYRGNLSRVRGGVIVRCWVEDTVAVLDLCQRYNGFLLKQPFNAINVIEGVSIIESPLIPLPHPRL